MTSVFETHREKVLGYYTTASWLRRLVLAMWNGNDYQVGLSRLATIDNEHFAAALAMIQAYRQNGERDEAFLSLAVECRQRVDAEKAAADRDDRLTRWCHSAQRAVTESGGRTGYVDDHYSWFESQFDLGVKPQAAATKALQSNLDAAAADTHS